MATYNGERFVGRQLASILPQLGPDDEVVISDDGSTDGTETVVRALADPRLRLVQNAGQHGPAKRGPTKRGPVGNFENALRLARGEYVFLSDQDDIWLPGRVGRMRPLLDRYELVVSDCEVVDAGGHTLMPSFFAHRGSRPGLWRNLYKNSYVGCCMAFRRSLLTRALPFPLGIYMHDWWLGLLAETRGQVYFLPEPTLKYVRHGGNASPTGEGSLAPYQQLKNRLTLAAALALRQLR